jgi:hypothetical protein
MNANQRFAVLGLLLMLGLGVIAARGPWEHAPKKLASPVRVESPAPVAPEPLIPVFIKVSHPISDRAARELALVPMKMVSKSCVLPVKLLFSWMDGLINPNRMGIWDIAISTTV